MAAPLDWHSIPDNTVIAVDPNEPNDSVAASMAGQLWLLLGGQRHLLSTAAYQQLGSPSPLLLNSGDIGPIPVGGAITNMQTATTQSTSSTSTSGSTGTSSGTGLSNPLTIAGQSMPIWAWAAIGVGAFVILGGRRR